MGKLFSPFSILSANHPLVPIVISFILGIIAASGPWLHSGLLFPFLIILLFLLMLGIIRRWKYNSLFICIIFFLLGNILAGQNLNPVLPKNHIRRALEQGKLSQEDNPEGVVVEGILYNAPERFIDRTRLYINAKEVISGKGVIPVSGKILITVKGPSVNSIRKYGTLNPAISKGVITSSFTSFSPQAAGPSNGVKARYGDRIRLAARLRMPQNFGNPGEFDYSGNLAREGIYVTGYVKNERWIAVLDSRQSNGWKIVIEGIRDRLRDFIDNSGVENTAIIKALIIGEAGEIPKGIRDNFSITGTAHILAISGLNIGIIAFVVYWIALRLFSLSERLMLAADIKKLAAVSSIIPVLLYGVIAGLSVSTQRAIIMVLIFILSVVINRGKGLYNTLAAAAFVILIISPPAVYDISFQLSFVSVLAIIYLVPKFQRLYYPEIKSDAMEPKSALKEMVLKHIGNYIFNPLAVTVAASIGTAPFVAYHFHRVSTIGAISNLIVVPFMGFIAVILGLASGFISFFSQTAAGILLKFSDIAIKFSVWIVDIFARLPYSSVFTATPTVLEAVLLYLLIICIAEFKRARFFKYVLPVVIIILSGNHIFWHYRLNYNHNLKVTFISVGQGDSALVEFPYGKRMLIDGGGFYGDDFDVGERIIAPFLWKNKIENVDYIALSHPQTDHMKGLRFIAERFNVKEFLWNGDIGEDTSYKELIRTIYENNISRSAVDESTPPLDINGVKVEFLNPRHDKRVGWNNDSVVLKLTYKNVGFLFTGDIEDIAEASLIEKGDAIKATVLKVPHHGSRTSSTAEFLKEVNPLVAVVSLGYLNPFGFPHPEILRRYRDLNIPLLRTDTQGAITIETDGMKINYRQKIAGY